MLLEKLIVAQLAKKFFDFYETRRFITVFTSVCSWFLSWARWIPSTHLYPVSLILRDLRFSDLWHYTASQNCNIPSRPRPSNWRVENFQTYILYVCISILSKHSYRTFSSCIRNSSYFGSSFDPQFRTRNLKVQIIWSFVLPITVLWMRWQRMEIVQERSIALIFCFSFQRGSIY
jgi:hypothetical protein